MALSLLQLIDLYHNIVSLMNFWVKMIYMLNSLMVRSVVTILFYAAGKWLKLKHFIFITFITKGNYN